MATGPAEGAIRLPDLALTSQGRILDYTRAACHTGSMAKVTGKLQITLPKALAERCGIRVGDDLEVRSAGRSIQIERRRPTDAKRLRQERLEHFDAASRRQQARQRGRSGAPARTRGWTREELYVRGRPR
jgi:AbrB family looped-hinge helix DNA binding protein